MSAGGDPLIGRIIAGKFRVDSLLGEGGMGMVYKATQVNLDKTVVLKVLRRSLLSDERTVARFHREARAASRLNHPNSIGVIDFGQADDGSMYLAMEYCPGHDLYHVISDQWPLDEARIARIISQVLSALAEAHAHGVIHRDLKPENIMIEQRRGEPDFVKVLDFGIAKIQDATGEEGQSLTRAGFVCGTPEYMSPEQAKGATVDHRSDLYAIGVILYQMVTGKLPFDSESAVGFATAHLTQDVPPLRRRRPECRCSPGLERLILSALAKDPNDRPQSAEAFRDELLRSASNPVGARSRGFNAARVEPTVASAVTDPSGWTDPTASDRGAIEATQIAKRSTRSRAAAPTAAVGLAVLGLLGAGGFYGYEAFLKKPAAPAEVPPVHAGSPRAARARQARESVDAGPELALSDVGGDEPAAGSTPDPVTARELLDRGTRALVRGKVPEAISLFRQAHRSDPANADAALKLALAYKQDGNRREAARWLRKYVQMPQAKNVALVERQIRELEGD